MEKLNSAEMALLEKKRETDQIRDQLHRLESEQLLLDETRLRLASENKSLEDKVEDMQAQISELNAQLLDSPAFDRDPFDFDPRPDEEAGGMMLQRRNTFPTMERLQRSSHRDSIGEEILDSGVEDFPFVQAVKETRDAIAQTDTFSFWEEEEVVLEKRLETVVRHVETQTEDEVADDVFEEGKEAVAAKITVAKEVQTTEDFSEQSVQDCGCQTNNNYEKPVILDTEEKECQTDNKENDRSSDETGNGYEGFLKIASYLFLAVILFTFFGKVKTPGRDFYPGTWMTWMPEPATVVEVKIEHGTVVY